MIEEIKTSQLKSKEFIRDKKEVTRISDYKLAIRFLFKFIEIFNTYPGVL